MNRNLSLKCTTDRLLKQYPPEYSISLRFEDCTVRCCTNSQALARRLQSYYAPFATERRTPDLIIYALQGAAPDVAVEFIPWERSDSTKLLKEEYADCPDGRIVRKTRTRMCFLFNDRLQFAVGPCFENDNQVINFINSRYIERRLANESLLLHAACVASGCRALTIAGASGAGKSTLALHFLQGGFDFLSNDRVILDIRLPGACVYGVPKLPRVNPGTMLHHPALRELLPAKRREELLQLSTEALWTLEEKYDVDVAGIFGTGRIRLLARLGPVLVLNWEQTNEPTRIQRVRLSDRPDLLAMMMKERGVFAYDAGRETPVDPPPRTYLYALQNCAVYEATGGVSFSAAVAFFSDLFECEWTPRLCVGT